MRRGTASGKLRRSRLVSAGCCLLIAGGLSAVGYGAQAQPHETRPVPEPLCSPVDRELEELSGLAVIGSVVYAVPDGGSSVAVAELADLLEGDCTVTRWLRNDLNPYDPEDLGAFNNRLWVADVGDNTASRDTVALVSVHPSDGSAKLHRLQYPDRARDAETILIDKRGMPIVVSKVLGVGEVFVPEGRLTVEELPSPGPTRLEQVGEIAFEVTDTPGGPVGAFGSLLATGGAVNSSGTIAAVRTYTDVYLYPDADGDLLAALRREPIVIPIPGEPQGEAIAFTEDGHLLTASELGFPITADPQRPPEAAEPLPPIQIMRNAEDYVWAAVNNAESAEPHARTTHEANAAGGPSDVDGESDREGVLDSLTSRAVAVGIGVSFLVLLAGVTVLLWRRRS